MANPKLGLNLGEKLQIADKQYRILNDGIKDIPDTFGKLTFVSYNGQDIVYDEDRVSTGEVRGLVISVSSAKLKEAIYFTLTDMSEAEFEALNLNFHDEVTLDDIVVTYSQVRNNQIKLFASRIKKAVQSQPVSQPKVEKEVPKK